MRLLNRIACVLPLVLGACATSATKPALSMEEWTRQTTEHKELVGGAGEWEGMLTMFVPGVPSQPLPAKETVEALGTHWLQSRFTCDFMGTPYVGTGCVGYDPATKRYVGTWVDSMSSYFSLMEGEKDASGRLVMRWMAPDETTGELVPHRSVSVESAQGRLMTFYKGEGEGTKTMTIEMRRK